MREKTEQEKFWEGDFGDQYVDRNTGEKIIAGNLALFSKILSRTEDISSVIELGCNIGLNMIAIHSLLPDAKLTGIEINKKASEIASRLEYLNVVNSSIYDVAADKEFDLVLTKGVLIHQPPEMLASMYECMYKLCRKYMILCEYYNPSPVEINYRGNSGVMFKRDFAGELLDKYPSLKLVDYGFVYHRDKVFPGDDLTWFLLVKAS